MIAFFEVYNKGVGAGFTNADLDRSFAAAQIASLAIHNRLLYQNLLALTAFSQSLTVTSDFDQLLEVVGHHMEANFKRCRHRFTVNGGLTPRFSSAEVVLSGQNSPQRPGLGNRARTPDV